MPTHTQGTVLPLGPAGTGGLGRRKDSNLKASFPSSPLYGEYTPESVLEIGVSALNGAGGKGDSSTGTADGIVNDSGHTFGTFDLNYTNSPVMADVKTGGGGLPASPYLPNPTSPGPGSVFANDQDAYTGELPAAGVEFGSGLGGTASPLDTAKGISSQTIGSYISGRSYQGSDGRV
jgi:hypothetical protein